MIDKDNDIGKIQNNLRVRNTKTKLIPHNYLQCEETNVIYGK